MNSKKLQSASEFLSIYGFAILGIAVFAIILYFLLTVPGSSVPNQCAFSGYLSCKDIAIGSNSVSSRAVFLFTNIQQYAIANVVATINMSSVGSFSGKCSPNVILPGGDLECVINFGVKITPNQLAKGTLSLNDKICTSTSGNQCGPTVPQSFGGTFTTHIAPLVPPPKCSISLDVQNATSFVGVKDMLTANVKILGYAISGATVNFTSTSANVFFSPSLANTDSNGNSTTYAFSGGPITGETLTATYANCSATNTIAFVKPIYLTFTSNTIGNSNDNLQYQSEVVNVNSNQYPASQLPTQIMAVSGTAQQYAFNDILPSTLTATRYNYVSTTGDCGASQISQTISPSTSCNVIGNYGTQYFLTTSVNPSNGGSLTPSSQWVDSGNQITINAVANTGYTFVGFTSTGAGSYNGSASSVPVTLNDPITETANFNINKYTLSLNPGNCASVAGAGTYDYGTTVTFNATPSVGYSFGHWTGFGSGAYNGSNQSPSVLMDSNILEIANCTINHYSLIESASPSGTGTVLPGDGTYAYGTDVAISESPASGYTFSGWTCGGAGCYSGSSSSATVNITSNVIETANFKHESPVTIYTNPSAASNYWGACFSTNASSTAPGGNGVTCTSIPAGNSSVTTMLPPGTSIPYLCTAAWYGTGGYYFSGWYVNGQFVSSTPCLNPGITTTTGTTSIEAYYQMGSFHTLTYTTPGTYYFTTPTGTTIGNQYQISAVGAGGGGGGGSVVAPSTGAATIPGTGAGGGAYVLANATGIPAGTTLTITVGSGGVYSTNSGTTGGSSSVGYSVFTITAGGGAGGQSEWDSSQAYISDNVYCAPINGGSGGSVSVSGSNVNVLTNDQGQPGVTNGMCEGDYNNGGNSGNNEGAGGASATAIGANGNPGGAYGGGGGGGSQVSLNVVPHTSSYSCNGNCYTVGGTGGNGMVSITWFGPP